MAPTIVVIASEPIVLELRTDPQVQPNTRIFSDTEFLAALEAILEDIPDIIALDPDFAATARGAALVARVKADPRLKGSQVRSLAPESPNQSLRVESVGFSTSDAPDLLQLDECGTRGAHRHPIKSDVETRVNGTASELVNLSVTGAQVIASQRLRPTEQVRLTLNDASTELRLKGSVAWANLEIGAQGLGSRYRIGLEFSDPDCEVLARYCQRNRES
jgi:hypothetical protein